MADFVASLERPRRVLIMVKAGGPTDAVIDELVPLLETGDIIIDAGNAHFPDTIRREDDAEGEGPALRRHRRLRWRGGRAATGRRSCRAGRAESYESLGPMLEKISAKVDGTPCCTYVGPDGAGHFVKMVHNGIEYADMQLIAEAYDLIRQGTGRVGRARSREIFATWNTGDLESFLIEITAEVLAQVDAETGQAVGRRDPRPGRAEGHRALDGAERARSGRADHRDRGGDVRPRAVRLGAAAGGGPGRAARRTPAEWAIKDPDGVRRGRPAGAVRVEGRRLLAGLRPDRRGERRSTAGTSTAGRWRGSGAVAASSGPGS